MAKKKSFSINYDLVNSVNHLSNEDAGLVFKWVLDYANDFDPKPLEGVLMLIIDSIKPKIKKVSLVPELSIIESFSLKVLFCYEQCLEHFDNTLHPKTENIKRNWLKTIDQLNRIDKVPFDLIEKVTERARNDDFWVDQFLSLVKLRNKNKDGLTYMVVFYNKFIKNAEQRIKTNSSGGATPSQVNEIIDRTFARERG